MPGQLKVFKDIEELLTLEGAASKAGRRVTDQDLGLIPKAAMVVLNGRLMWVGPSVDCTDSLLETWGGRARAEVISLADRVVLPGFVEAHTHLVFAGQRIHEFEWRIQGQSYQEIAAKGGGIRSTVTQTRAASSHELRELAQRRADRFVRQGVTSLEIKSGYGLDLDTEIRCLQVARSLRGPRIVTTYLGPHSRSPEYPDFDDYINTICKEILPKVKDVADRVDIYIEKGFFSPQQAERYFQQARLLGLEITAHAEQLSDSGGAAMSLNFSPQSLDHLVFVGEDVIDRIARSETTAVLLPTSDFYLRMAYPKARRLIDAGARVAISTDFNPGTSPTQDLSLVGVLSRLEMKMTLAETIVAFTLGGAHALGIQDNVGSLTIGKYADFVVLDGTWQELFYSVGHHPVWSVYKAAEEI